MYVLKTEQSFDSAHFLFGYQGKCSNIHGHRWKVVVEVYGAELENEGQQRGMIVDFGKLKADLKAEADSLDHALIIEKGSLREKTLNCLIEDDFNIIQVDFRPTAENLSKYFYDKMKEKKYKVKEVTVYETPNNAATFLED